MFHSVQPCAGAWLICICMTGARTGLMDIHRYMFISFTTLANVHALQLNLIYCRVIQYTYQQQG